MLRLIVIAVAWLGLLSTALGSVSSHKAKSLREDLVAFRVTVQAAGEEQESRPTTPARAGVPVSVSAHQGATSAPPSPEYRLTHNTQVLLDGKPCAFERIPASATIIRMDVEADSDVILRIQFRTAK